MNGWKAVAVNLLLVGAAVAVALVLVGVVLAAAGYPAWRIAVTWIRGAGGTPGDWLVALKNACPLLLTGLAAGVAFRTGVFNIGAEGQSCLGAAAAVALATRLWPGAGAMPVAIPAALVAAAAGGAAWAAVAAALDRFRGVPVVLSTLLLNFVALQLLGVLLEGPLKTHTSAIVQSDMLPAAYHLPVLLSRPGGYVHAGILIAVAFAAGAWVVQARTPFGFEVLVTGLNPVAATYAGMPVAGRQFAVMLASGAFAGVAGAVQVMGVEGHSLGPTPVSYGYAGIAVALLGRLHPAGIAAAALFFGLLDRGASTLEFIQLEQLRDVADIIKGLIVLFVLAGTAAVARRVAAGGQ
jgi:simple sugar transport system permease protein